MPLEALPFDLIKVLPYVLVLVLALCCRAQRVPGPDRGHLLRRSGGHLLR